jgi:hypothetical protein
MNDEVRLNFVAGIREDVIKYFMQVRAEVSDKIKVIYSDSLYDYFDSQSGMRTTDILWTNQTSFHLLCLVRSHEPGEGSGKFNRNGCVKLKQESNRIIPNILISGSMIC